MEMNLSRFFTEKVNTIIILAVFFFSLSPIIIVGLHSRLSLDDYAFSAVSVHIPSDGYLQHHIQRSVRYAMQNTGIAAVPRAVFRTVWDNYFGWQGTFTAVAVFSVHPAVIFGDALYPLTMIFTLFALIGSTAFLMKSVFGKGWVLPCVLMLTASIQWVPGMPQTFFWWNGSAFYTFFYCTMLINIGFKLRFLRGYDSRAGRLCHVAWVVAICFLDFLIGGGNYVTALMNFLVNGLVLLMLLGLRLGKHKSMCTALFAVASLAGLLISALAPGNAVRQGMMGQSNPVLWSVNASVTLALRDLAHWTSPVILLLAICAVPWMWRCAKETEFSFPFPLLVVISTFLLFASQNAPPLYAMGFGGDYRLRNIVFYSYIWLVFGNMFYVLGWLGKRMETLPLEERVRKLLPFTIIPLIALVFALGYGTSNARACILDLRERLPQQFLVEHNQRLALLHDATHKTVELPAFTAFPATLLPWHDGVGFTYVILTSNPDNWRNQMVAAYYGKAAVVGLPATREVAEYRQVAINAGRHTVYLDAFSIHYQHFFRLRDLAYVLEDAFDVGYAEGSWTLFSGRRYTIAGDEGRVLHDGLDREPATLYAADLLFDGAPKEVLAYVIREEVFFRLQDVLELVGMQAGWRGGYIWVGSA